MYFSDWTDLTVILDVHLQLWKEFVGKTDKHRVASDITRAPERYLWREMMSSVCAAPSLHLSDQVHKEAIVPPSVPPCLQYICRVELMIDMTLRAAAGSLLATHPPRCSHFLSPHASPALLSSICVCLLQSHCIAVSSSSCYVLFTPSLSWLVVRQSCARAPQPLGEVWMWRAYMYVCLCVGQFTGFIYKHFSVHSNRDTCLNDYEGIVSTSSSHSFKTNKQTNMFSIFMWRSFLWIQLQLTTHQVMLQKSHQP